MTISVMTKEEIQTELRSCLKLQNEIADKTDELTSRYKAVCWPGTSLNRNII